jgi:hypothetical protein
VTADQQTRWRVDLCARSGLFNAELAVCLFPCRSCSTPFHVTPYQGKYSPPDTTPDEIGVQKVRCGHPSMAAKGVGCTCAQEKGYRAVAFPVKTASMIDVQTSNIEV